VRALCLAVVLVATPVLAQEPPPPPCPCQACAVTCADVEDDEPPSQAARETVEIAQPPPRHLRGHAVGELGVLPGYMHLLGSDFLGTQLSLGVGGEGHSGFAALARFGGFFGATTFGVAFEHLTVAAAFVIPTGTRFHLELGHQFGVIIVQQPHTSDGSAYSPTMGGYAGAQVDVYHRDRSRVALVGRVAYDYVFVNRGPPSAITLNVGLTYSF